MKKYYLVSYSWRNNVELDSCIETVVFDGDFYEARRHLESGYNQFLYQSWEEACGNALVIG